METFTGLRTFYAHKPEAAELVQMALARACDARETALAVKPYRWFMAPFSYHVYIEVAYPAKNYDFGAPMEVASVFAQIRGCSWYCKHCKAVHTVRNSHNERIQITDIERFQQYKSMYGDAAKYPLSPTEMGYKDN